MLVCFGRVTHADINSGDHFDKGVLNSCVQVFIVFKKTTLELGNDHYCRRNASVVFGVFSAVGYFLCSVAL